MEITYDKFKMYPDSGVYAITNTITGERYIGGTTRIADRFAQHRGQLRHGHHCNPLLQAAWDRYGEAAFSFDVLERIPGAVMGVYSQERGWIARERPAYNRLPWWDSEDRAGIIARIAATRAASPPA